MGAIGEEEILVDGDRDRVAVEFEPARLDWALYWMNQLSRYPFFVHRILVNLKIFSVSKRLVRLLRSIGVVR